MRAPLLLLYVLGGAVVSSGEIKSQEDTWKQLRMTMIKEQLVSRDIKDSNVLRVMGDVPRHLFLPRELQSQAYDDRPLPIGHQQTISQPYIVAFMTEQLRPESHHRILEIGTGSGYQAAVLAELVDQVFSIEIVEPLAREAKNRLARLGYQNVTVKIGDGYLGWLEEAPFDGIIVTCAPDKIPEPLIQQLKEGGRLVIPAGPSRGQILYVFAKQNDRLETLKKIPVRFVPMTGKVSEKR
ncbi:MAG: protein-L-isoaspartate(D-aspartate) O-methyltransferase [Verrucomicrobiota bacterium]